MWVSDFTDTFYTVNLNHKFKKIIKSNQILSHLEPTRC